MKLIHTSQASIFTAWAAAVRPEDQKPFRNRTWGSENIFCEGPSIFSYGRHFELGRHVDLDKHYVVLNHARYSVSTTNHQWGLDVQTAHLNQLLVPHQDLIFNSAQEAFAESAKVDSVWYESIEDLGKQLLNKRVRTSQRYYNRLLEKKTQLVNYYEAYRLVIPNNVTKVFDLLDDPAVMARVEEQREQEAKVSRNYSRLRHFQRKEFQGDIDFAVLKIAFMGEAKVKSLKRLPEDKIIELAVRTGFDVNRPWGY